MRGNRLRFIIFHLLFVLASCSIPVEKSSVALPGSPPPGTESEIAELAKAIQALGPDIDPLEADAAARAAYTHTHELAVQYEITDRALVHNVKVNLGIKPRGLCKHWAQDMEKRLKAEDFQTLTIHRAIGAMVGVDHSTVIISRKGEDMFQGIVVDPWRDGGRLTWIATAEDMRWGWRPQFEVLDPIAAETARKGGRRSIVFMPEGGETPRCLVLNARNGFTPSTTDLSACGHSADSTPRSSEMDVLFSDPATQSM